MCGICSKSTIKTSDGGFEEGDWEEGIQNRLRQVYIISTSFYENWDKSLSLLDLMIGAIFANFSVPFARVGNNFNWMNNIIFMADTQC